MTLWRWYSYETLLQQLAQDLWSAMYTCIGYISVSDRTDMRTNELNRNNTRKALMCGVEPRAPMIARLLPPAYIAAVELVGVSPLVAPMEVPSFGWISRAMPHVRPKAHTTTSSTRMAGPQHERTTARYRTKELDRQRQSRHVRHATLSLMMPAPMRAYRSVRTRPRARAGPAIRGTPAPAKHGVPLPTALSGDYRFSSGVTAPDRPCVDADAQQCLGRARGSGF
jgi:hypothetical protein